MSDRQRHSVFNSPLETGIRALAILVSNYPESMDTQRLVDFDYLVVHSGDVDGPPSLHPPLPMREGELLIRRKLIESGLLLMASRGLINRELTSDGISFKASNIARPFLDKITATYIRELIARSDWAANSFGEISNRDLQTTITRFFNKWTTQFSVTTD